MGSSTKDGDAGRGAAGGVRDGDAAARDAAAGAATDGDAGRVVRSSMIGMGMPDAARWSPAVAMVLGQNPGPFTGPGTNTYVVGTGRERLLLETGEGVEGYDDLLVAALGEHASGAELDRIVLTHSHPDHIGGVDRVRARHGELPLWKFPHEAGDRGHHVQPLADGDVVEVEGATLEALWTPGHARDHLCFVLREEKVLFSGDNVLGAGTTVIPPDGDLEDYLQSLRRLLALDIERIFPAHGPVIENPKARIQEYLSHRALRDAQVMEGLQAGLTRTRDLVRRIYTDVPEYLHEAAGVSVEAHLRRFEKLGRVERDGADWVWRG